MRRTRPAVRGLLLRGRESGADPFPSRERVRLLHDCPGVWARASHARTGCAGTGHLACRSPRRQDDSAPACRPSAARILARDSPPRTAWPQCSRTSATRSARWAARPASRGRRADAGARHRRQHRHLQPARPGGAAARSTCGRRAELVQLDGPGTFRGRTTLDRAFSHPMFRDLQEGTTASARWSPGLRPACPSGSARPASGSSPRWSRATRSRCSAPPRRSAACSPQPMTPSRAAIR